MFALRPTARFVFARSAKKRRRRRFVTRARTITTTTISSSLARVSLLPSAIRLTVDRGGAAAASAAGGNRCSTTDYHYFWLRHNCDCRETATSTSAMTTATATSTTGTGTQRCRHAATNERVVEPIDIPTDIQPIRATIEPVPSPSSSSSSSSSPSTANPVAAAAMAPPFSLHIEWSDGHRSQYTSDWLNAHTPPHSVNRPAAAAAAAATTSMTTTLGRNHPPRGDSCHGGISNGTELARELLARAPGPDLDVAAVSADYHRGSKLDSLQRLRDAGVLVVRNGPRRPEDSITLVRERFGAELIATHFGLIEDLKVNNTTNTNNDQLGYTNSEVRLHTDQPFIDQPPTMQMLHCIQPAEKGGSTTICDASAVANFLRMHRPDLFMALAFTPCHFHRKQKAFTSLSVQPIVRLDQDMNVAQIRSSYFTLGPLRASFDLIPLWYTAYNTFTALTRSKRFCYYLDLQAGDFLVYDNYRMLHGRTGFGGTQRFLRGIYLDKEQVFKFLST